MAEPRKVQGYGWRRDLPDPRDRIYNLEAEILRGDQVPSGISLRSEMPPVYDQGQLGSCTANAAAAVMQHAQMKQGEAQGQHVPSRLFVYYEERRLEGSPLDQDTGAEVRTGVKVLATEGAPDEASWAYDISKFAERAPDSVYQAALAYEAVVYRSLQIGMPGAPMRTALSRHQPIAFGFPVPQQFEDPSWDPRTTPLPIPGASTQFIGGHAVVVVGYDFTLSRFQVPAFEIRNSWGEAWGDQGHFWMDFRWFDRAGQLASDLWVVDRTS